MSKKIFVEEHNVQILHSHSRALLVLCTTRCFTCLYASLHAPHSHDTKRCQLWWENLARVFQEVRERVGKDIPIVVFLDANARTPVPDGCLIGPYGYKGPSPTSKFFAKFLNDTSLWVPASFDENMRGGQHPGTYYWNKDALPVRIDYVLLSRDWCVTPSSSHNFHIELGFDSVDHLATLLRATPIVTVSVAAPKRRIPSYNRALVKDPE
eukprot:9331325-Karenia_brevis.AAC.1